VTLVALLGLLLVGELRAWWLPYFVGTTPERVTRYTAMFGKPTRFCLNVTGLSQTPPMWPLW